MDTKRALLLKADEPNSVSERLNLMWASLEELNALCLTLLTESGSSRLAIEVRENAKLPIVTSDDGNESTVSAPHDRRYELRIVVTPSGTTTYAWHPGSASGGSDGAGGGAPSGGYGGATGGAKGAGGVGACALMRSTTQSAGNASGSYTVWKGSVTLVSAVP